MAEIKLQNTDYVRFILQAKGKQSLVMNIEPGGWSEDELEIVRHKKYHGIFTQFTNALSFKNEAKEYIRDTFDLEGLNADLFLIKQKLKKETDPFIQTLDNGITDIKWKTDYIGLADFNTLSEEDYAIKIVFNSNALEELIKSHETDIFEIERLDSIDSIPITQLHKDKVSIDGRGITLFGESDILGFNFSGANQVTLLTYIISQGHLRHSSVDTVIFPGVTLASPSNMFFVDDTASGPNIRMKVSWDIDVKIDISNDEGDPAVKIELLQMRFNSGAGEYNLINTTVLHTGISVTGNYINISGSNLYTNLQYKDGLAIVFTKLDATGTMFIDCTKHHITIETSEFWEPSIGLDFVFVNSAISRLMEILTGKRKKFYSKLFGRKTEISANISGDGHNYEKDGEYSYIGLISGFWIRAFDSTSNKYKSLQLSIKDGLDSIQAVFNTGMSIETINFEQRLRIEDLKYFYQNKVVIKLPIQATNIKRKVDGDLYFSGAEIGYSFGGDYENEIGLDEPNTQTSYVTPLRKTTNKFRRISKIRSDEYGLELIRRKPQEFFPEEDTSQDEHNWFLDLKKSDGSNYIQKEWADRLVQEPEGVLQPSTYKSFLFTPLRMLFRHGWILRAGLEQSSNMIKFFKYISSKANTTLKTWFIGESQAYQENDDIIVNSLERSRFLPEEISFNHPVDDNLLELILGTTKVEYPIDSGTFENIPNVYFKMEFINENEKKETGYLLNLKPKNSGEFVFQKANENIII